MPGTPKSVLVADDDADMRLFVGSTLAQIGYEVIFANDGHDALMRINERFFDLIVLDIMMPNLNGLALLATLKKHERTKDTPVLMVSSREDAQAWAATVNLGAKKFLHKPFSAADLASSVKESNGPPLPSSQ